MLTCGFIQTGPVCDGVFATYSPPHPVCVRVRVRVRKMNIDFAATLAVPSHLCYAFASAQA